MGNQAFSKIWIIIIFIILLAGGILAWQYRWIPKEEMELSEKLNCVSFDLPGYEVVNEFFVDFNNDKQDELVRVYAQNVEGGCGAELPIVVKIFSGTTACHKEEFTYPETLAPISSGFDDERYNSADARLMKNFWGDGRDVILVSGALNFCGSGTRGQLLFFGYQDGEYIKVNGPIFGELDFHSLSPSPEGKAILVARAEWEEGETHFGPHRYTFVLYQWDGQEYEEAEIATTNNKYTIGDENFESVLRNIQTVFQNEPEKLQLEIEKL